MELEEGLGEGEVEYSITVRKLIRYFDSVWVSSRSRAGRTACRLLDWQSKHVHRELKGRRPQAFQQWLVFNKYQRKRGKFLNGKLKTETLKVPHPPQTH